MSRRIVTDAKIVLLRAGYIVTYDKKELVVWVDDYPEVIPEKNGTVDNKRIVELLAARGCDAWGYPRR